MIAPKNEYFISPMKSFAFEKKIAQFSHHPLLVEAPPLDKELEEERWYLENSLYLFVEKAWPNIYGDSHFIPGWHIQAICEHLEALYKLEISNLVINVPPRTAKSSVCSVIYPAWVWTKNPSLRFLYAAYAQSLSIRDSVNCRRLIQSRWYQRLWGDKVILTGDVNNKLRFENTKSGNRIASSVGGSNTGEGGHFFIADDPNNVVESESETIRNSTNDWFDFTMSSRHAGIISEFRRLVIQQRCHSYDVSGNILSKNDKRWIHLSLPMEFEKSNRCKTILLRMSNGKVWQDPRTKEGELLWPAGINAQQLKDFKEKDFRGDSYRIAGQLQQRPSPAMGGIINTKWFKVWDERDYPKFDYVLQSWDTSLTGNSKSAYSACTTWGVFTDPTDTKNIMLLSLYKGRVEYPELRKMAQRLAKNYYDTDLEDPEPAGHSHPADLVLIEAKVSGYSLASDLMRLNIPIMRFNPNIVGDKVARCRRVTDLIENGLVWLPCDYPSKTPNAYAQKFIEDASLFPNGESNDVIDSMSQALIRLKQTGWVYHKDDYKPEKTWDWSQYKE